MRRERKSLIISYKEYLNVITGKDSNLFQSVSIYNLNSKQDQIYNYKTSPWSSILFVRLGMEGATGLMNFSQQEPAFLRFRR